MDFLTQLFQRYSVPVGAIGLCGLALYQFSQQDYSAALHSAVLALGAFGLHLNFPNQDSK